MPYCHHCTNDLGKKKKFESNKFNSKYCLESEDCISAWRQDRINGLPKQKAVKQKADDKTARENNKKLSDLESEAKKSFQKWIRLRDADQPCISCGIVNTDDWCGSHYFPAGTYSGTIFDERNVHKSCNNNCNRHLSGNLIEYRINLVAKYGLDFVTALESDAIRLKQYRYTRDDLKALKRKYDAKIKNGDFECDFKPFELPSETQDKVNEKSA